jgi:chromosome segregation ATPase
MLLETLPELILQLANGILLRNFTIIGYISITVSAYFALNELYVFIYYVYYKKMSLENVPLTIEIPNKNRVTSLDSQHSTIRDELEMEKFTSIPVDVEKHQINVGGVADGFISLRPTSDLKDSDIFSSLELRVHKIEKDTELNKSEIIRLTEENNELREESVALLSEIKQLYNENKTLAAVSASLQSEIGRISKESDELLKNSVVYREDISKLRSKVESLL